MNISLKWLNTYLDRPVDAEEAGTVLTSLGFPLEEQIDLPSDTLLDIEITSNRGDMLSHIGVARDLAAATGRKLVQPDIVLSCATDDPIESFTSVDNQALDLCPLYTARLIRNVNIAPSPDWLVQRIEAIGLRSVNNVVDITNFIMYEMGQPLHAFDFNLLKDKRIIVRRAKQGENFIAIDSSKHTLTPSMLVIADTGGPVAVAGIMGGMDSEVGNNTTDILLESAVFAHDSIRSTSRALKLASDSSYRFERIVDSQNTDRCSQRATQLILELASGSLAGGVITAGIADDTQHTASLRPERCRKILGYQLSTDRITQYLTALGLKPIQTNGNITCTIPSHRPDIRREADLIEEVARLHGFDHIEIKTDVHVTIKPPQLPVKAKRTLERIFTAHGYCETITFTTISDTHASLFLEPGIQLIHLADSSRRAESALRPSTLPGLLRCRKTNQDVGNKDVRLYEIASCFIEKDGNLSETRELAFLSDAPDTDHAMRQLRGMIDELANALGKKLKITTAQHRPEWAEAAAYVTDADTPDKIIGIYAPANNIIIKQFDLQTPVVMGWLDYEAMIENYPPQPNITPLQRFPAIERDLSVILDNQIHWSKIAACVNSVQPELMESLQFVGAYRGKQIGTDKKSVTLRMIFRDPDKTLTHDEVDTQVEQVLTKLKQDLAVDLRSA